ncbi:MAG TPA: thioredoxin domain-containing protein [Puia sp.]|jgi:protein-disulfide isomerase|nr:thioredoxin domain-containing protein [Puia sp.]
MSKLRIPVNDLDHRTGDQTGKVILVEYGDYQCPHCGIAHPLIQRLLKQFNHDLLFVFRNFPLQEVHPQAMIAAQAAEAANFQNKFWEMHDIIFEHQDSLSGKSLLQDAKMLHLSVDRFSIDWSSKEVISKVETDFEGGIRSGVNGTPAFFVNGNILRSYDATFESLAHAVKSAG